MLLKRFLLNSEVRDLWDKNLDDRLLQAYEHIWERKVILRVTYETWYRLIKNELKPGNLVEIGAGTGNFKRWLRDRTCWTLDLLPGRHIQVQADALSLPFLRRSVDNFVMIDALHHLAQPADCLHQIADSLKPGGRLIILEPFVSIWGWFVYKFLHHERVAFHITEPGTREKPWDGNAAIAQMLLARRNRDRIPLHLVQLRHLEFLSYPLSGGFTYRQLLPLPLLLALRNIENHRFLKNRLLALRQFAVLEK